MAKGFKHGAGGGTPLNFKVVGGTSAPSNPKENTIWVNTDTQITHWAFSATRPDNLIKSYYIEPSLDRFITVLYAEMDLKPHTTYTIAFEGNAGQEFYLNEAITPYKAFAVTPYWNTVTFTTHSELDKSSLAQYLPSYGWLLLKNEINQPSAPAFRGLRIVEGDKDIEPTGMVWFSIGTSSPMAFNALKKNRIQVYPVSAKQYVSGAWVEREAKIYQGGSWVDWWNGELYSYGDEFEAITGGFSNFNVDNGSTTFESNSIKFYNSKDGQAGVCTKNKVDLSTVNKLQLTIKNFTCSSDGAWLWLFISDTAITDLNNVATDAYAIYQSSAAETNVTKEIILDVSSVTGSKYVGAALHTTYASVTATAYISELKGE